MLLLLIMGGLFALTHEGIFLILIAGALYRFLWKKDHAPEPDQGAFAEFAGLLILFAAMLALIPMTPPAGRG